MTSSARSYPVHLPEDILNLTVEYIEKRVDILSLAKTHNCFRGIISVLHQFREINVSHINNSSLWVLLLNNPYLAWNVRALRLGVAQNALILPCRAVRHGSDMVLRRFESSAAHSA